MDDLSFLDRACIIVPAFEAGATVAKVIADLREAIPELRDSIIVVDDGSTDDTWKAASALECIVITSAGANERPPVPLNLGKGAALRAGFEEARRRGKTVAVTVDADNQHPAVEARKVLFASANEQALVLGIRDLVRDGAPKANVTSNGISNFFISRFAGKALRDTQCGLRRYPIEKVLTLAPRGRGYDFEAEVILRSVWAGVDVVEETVAVLYPVDRKTHFHVARDPWRIIRTVVAALGERWLAPHKSSDETVDEKA